GRERDAVLAGNAERADPDRGQWPAGGDRLQQVAGGPHAPGETGPGALLGDRLDRRGAEPGPGRFADRGGDLRTAEVEPEHDRRVHPRLLGGRDPALVVSKLD